MAEYRYVVRGALVECDKGNTPSRLNLPKSYGVYVLDKPVMNETDTAAMVNIMPFGKCSKLDGPCAPAPLPCWEQTKKDTLVEEQPALITISILGCTVGGTIMIKNDGHQP